MDYQKRLDRMDEHLNKHPHDYQTVVSRMKIASEAYDSYVRQVKNARLHRLSEIKNKLREEDECRGINCQKLE